MRSPFLFSPSPTRGQRAEPETYVALPAPRSGAGHSDKIKRPAGLQLPTYRKLPFCASSPFHRISVFRECIRYGPWKLSLHSPNLGDVLIYPAVCQCIEQLVFFHRCIIASHATYVIFTIAVLHLSLLRRYLLIFSSLHISSWPPVLYYYFILIAELETPCKYLWAFFVPARETCHNKMYRVMRTKNLRGLQFPSRVVILL